MVEDDQVVAADLLSVAVRTQVEAAEDGQLDSEPAAAEADRLLARMRRAVETGVRLPAPGAALLTAIAERSRLDVEPDAGAWRAARDAWAAIKRPYDTTYADLRLAEALAVTHGPRDELERVLREAHERATGIEAVHLADALEALARRTRIGLPGLEGTDGAAFGVLTKREREVLGLVAQGRTNRQIAQELFITDKTASVHVSNILGKLGAANRGEAAALAHSAGFEPVSQAR
jgi:DNA-binding CsgD family transcriptional regulator